VIDLPLLEQFDRLLWAAAVGILTVPLWYLATRLGRRRTLRHGLAEATLLSLLSLAAAGALFLGTLGDLRAYVPVGFACGAGVAGALLRILHAPWQETRRERRN